MAGGLRGEMKQVRKTKKPGTGDPLHTQEPVAVASFRTWRGWRENVARGRYLTLSILSFKNFDSHLTTAWVLLYEGGRSRLRIFWEEFWLGDFDWDAALRVFVGCVIDPSAYGIGTHCSGIVGLQQFRDDAGVFHAGIEP